MGLRRAQSGRIERANRENKYRLRARTKRSVPDRDSDFACMGRVFANHIASDGGRLGVSPEQSAKLSAAVEAFREALYRTKVYASAGPRATMVKNTARAEAKRIVRAVRRSLSASEQLTNVDRMLLNMPARPKRLKARLCPNAAPVLRFVEATARGRHVLEYRNDFDLASKAKPHGVARLELFVGLVAVGGPSPGIPGAPGDLGWAQVQYLRSYTTSRFEVEYPVLEDGSPVQVVYWGRWADARGNVGPWSKTCVARVEGGAVPELVYLGAKRAALPGGALGGGRQVDGRQFAMLEAQFQLFQGTGRVVRPLAGDGGSDTLAA